MYTSDWDDSRSNKPSTSGTPDWLKVVVFFLAMIGLSALFKGCTGEDLFPEKTDEEIAEQSF